MSAASDLLTDCKTLAEAWKQYAEMPHITANGVVKDAFYAGALAALGVTIGSGKAELDPMIVIHLLMEVLDYKLGNK